MAKEHHLIRALLCYSVGGVTNWHESGRNINPITWGRSIIIISHFVHQTFIYSIKGPYTLTPIYSSLVLFFFYPLSLCFLISFFQIIPTFNSIPTNNLVYFYHISTANPLPIIYLESNRMVNLPYIGYLQSLRYSWILKVNEILNPIIVIIPQYFVDCSSQLLFYWFRWFDFFRYYIVLWSW